MKRWRCRDSMALRNEAAASAETNLSSMSASCMSVRSPLFLRNAFPFTPFTMIRGLLLFPSTAVNWPTVDVR